MALNTSPIFTGTPDIQGGDILVAAGADFTGQSTATIVSFSADATNGGFVQRIRFKPVASGSNIATVARIFVNNGSGRLAAAISTPTAPTGSTSTTGGTLTTNVSGYFAKVVAQDQYGTFTSASPESAGVNIAGVTGSITWNWTAVVGATSYRLYVGPIAWGQNTYFTTSTNSYVQTTAVGVRDSLGPTINNNNTLIGEVSLPATVATTAASTVEIDYPLNIALPPGYRILVNLGTAVATGWIVTTFGGKY